MEEPGAAEDLDEAEDASEAPVLFVDAATRVSRPSGFDTWYYGIEDRLGQGTVGMGVCFIVFIIALLFAIVFHPI